MIGANLAYRLVEQGCEVFVIARPQSDLRRIRDIRNKVEVLFADITDAKSVRDAIFRAQPGTLFHLASTPFNPDVFTAEDHFRVNVMGTIHILEAMKEIKGARLVFTSSAAEYGGGERLSEESPVDPKTVLGASKASATLLIRAFERRYGVDAVVLRLFTPYGPWESNHRLIPSIIVSALQGKDVLISEGKQKRDFVYIEDVVTALVSAGSLPIASGSIVNIASGSSTAVHEVASLVLRLMGDPVKLVRGAVPTRPDEIMEISADISKAEKVLAWKPQVSLEEGLKRTIAWFKEQNIGAYA